MGRGLLLTPAQKLLFDAFALGAVSDGGAFGVSPDGPFRCLYRQSNRISSAPPRRPGAECANSDGHFPTSVGERHTRRGAFPRKIGISGGRYKTGAVSLVRGQMLKMVSSLQGYTDIHTCVGLVRSNQDAMVRELEASRSSTGRRLSPLHSG